MDHNIGLEPKRDILDARSRRTRATLRKTLLTLLEGRPFDQISIREITGQAKIGYATYFRHYASKEALLDDLADSEIAQLLAHAVPLLTAADSYASCLALCSFVAGKKALWSALLAGGASATVRETFIRQARALAAGVAGANAPKDWLPQDLKVVYATGGTIDILAWWLQFGADIPVETVALYLDKLVIAPTVATRDG